MASETPPKPKAGLSLYANLLSPKTSGGSGTSVTFNQPIGSDAATGDAASQKQQISAAALRFQPTKRPQIAPQKPSHKVVQAKIASIVPPPVPTNPVTEVQSLSTRQAAPPSKTSIADWTGDGDEEDINGFYGEKRQRGGRKKRKKNKEEAPVSQNWDGIYDPSRPNNYEEYKNSEEKIREIHEWKDRLYAHRTARRNSFSSDGSDSEGRTMNRGFAPPPASAFAPPPLDLNRSPSPAPPPPPPPLAADILDDATGDEAYARRLRMTQLGNQAAPIPPSLAPPSPSPPSPPPPPPPVDPYLPQQSPHQQSPPLQNTSNSGASSQYTISRAPVRYNLPAAPADIPRTEDELNIVLNQAADSTESQMSGDAEDADGEAIPRSLRPGQKGFAERLMARYGWTKGTGLGANNSGIINPLRVQVEKQKKKPDSEGGGLVGPGGRGKILGGKKKSGTEEEEGGKFGAMSDVVILRGMVDGMDLDYELGEGNLMQEIGEECGEKYGRVERVYIDKKATSNVPVFIKFTNQLSALRAVNALEGRIFNGNTIIARFFDADEFAKEILT